ncbi:MAG: M23 family metallopeptidase [Prolixibacteraceae bacterium]|nr:M23 family metallopeptidase [Prolixibacteraceae bacterium]MBN2775719.1 M23 family metallopeptidase [Prolixibacteraceae bacterium]
MRGIVLSVLLLVSIRIYPQEKFFSEPLKIPILITGSFAELRTDHFHSGIDIKTEGRTGLPVYPAADGYISRIVVSPAGFGNALYINHNNQTTTLYGHLQEFNKAVSAYVKNIQYKNESFSVDISVPPGIFQVSKDEIIAYSGNSGSSGGPHLHFEIRDKKTQEPLNPFEFNLNIVDKTAPLFTGLKIYPLDENTHIEGSGYEKSYQVVKYNGGFHIANNPLILLYGEIGFGVEVTDYLDGTWSKCGINHLRVKIDGLLFSSIDIERYSFNDTRYLNSLTDYKSYIKYNHRFYKTWKDPGNKLDFYTLTNNDGSIEFTDNQKHNIEIVAIDSYGNESELEFIVKSNIQDFTSKKEKGFQTFYYNKVNSFNAEGISLYCPVGAFYSDFEFDYNVDYQTIIPGLFSNIHKVHHNYSPIHDPIKLAVKTKNLPDRLQEKALIVKIDEKTGKKNSVGGSFKNGFVECNIRAFGDFAVSVDTIAPIIRSLSISNNILNEVSQIRFRISDELSGIKSYLGIIDGKWALFEYDAKNSLLSYKFDPERMEFNKNHTLHLTVSDNKNNTAVYEASFFK